jgi:hypothetical protein
MGRLIGWIDDDVYLEPDASYAEAQDMARHQGDSLPVQPRTLWRRMREQGHLATWDQTRQRNTVRRKLGGVDRREVIHLRRDALYPPCEPSQPSQTLAPPCDDVANVVDGSRDDQNAGDSLGSPTVPTNAKVPIAEPTLRDGRDGRVQRGDAPVDERPNTESWGDWQ